jgi:lysophospholipase
MELYPTPENPAPPGAVCLPVLTRDRILLRAMHARPSATHGTVVILGGRGDFFERYFETMRDLRARGFAVASVDFRGQGGSEGRARDAYRSTLRTFKDHDEDLRAFIEEVVKPECPPPYYAIGHSTGGHVLLRAIRQEKWFRKVILVSPLVDVLYGAWPRPLAAFVVNAGNLLGLGRLYLPGVPRRPLSREDFDSNLLTSDQWRWNRDSATLEVAPHLGLGGATFAWFKAARASLAAVRHMRKPQSPVLIIASGADRVVSNDATRELARTVPGIALAVIPGARHEILTERDDIRRQFLAAFDSFITLDRQGIQAISRSAHRPD